MFRLMLGGAAVAFSSLVFMTTFPATVRGQQGSNTDLFNYYHETKEWEEGIDYGQEDWDQVGCDDLETCYGWPEKWHNGRGWQLKRNSCRDCREGEGKCTNHNQSPINLDRVLWGPKKRTIDNETYNCGDHHGFEYHEGTCEWKDFQRSNSITVERHALRISQPIQKVNDTHYELACPNSEGENLFSRLDMSGGYSHWWFLNHIEIRTPSEHTQNGKRYAAEIQMGLFFSEPPSPHHPTIKNGWKIRMATIGIFLDAREEYEPYPQLDKLICEWRRYEQNVRTECGLRPIETHYPGCFAYHHSGMTTGPFHSRTGQRRLNETQKTKLRRSSTKLNAWQEALAKELVMDPDNWRESDWTKEEWAKFQEEYSRQHPLNATKQFDFGRHLCDYDHVPFDNFQFLKDCRTEYYFRYQGTSTYPPCFTESNNWNTNVWRVMKDPIRIHPRQVQEMHRLLRERIAPLGSYNGSPKECTPDTAAKIMDNGMAWVARDLQELDDSAPLPGESKHDARSGSEGHDNFYCDCNDWGSDIPEDSEYCRVYHLYDDVRWEKNPYNYGDFTGF